MQRNAFDLDTAANRVARRAGNRGHDRTILTDELIQKARLADIGLSDQHDLETLEQKQSVARAPEQSFQRLLQSPDFPGHVRGVDEVDIVLGKVEGRLDEHSKLHQPVEKGVNLA